ncbi:MAG: family 1 glycosylhydrolase [Archangium sp.]
MRAAVVVLFLFLTSGCATVPVAPLPDDFQWGVATSGFQSEGSAPDSNWTRYVARREFGHEPYENSVDFLRRFEEDIALAASLGVNTFRFSIEWARVMPARGVIDADALRFYDAVFAALAKHHLTPMPTLLHFVMPGWVLDEGGLGNNLVLSSFAEFVELVAKRYAGRGARWITLNEASYFLTLERRHGSLRDDEVERAKDRLTEMHVHARATLRRYDPSAPVSTNVVWEPAPASWFDDWFFDRVKDRIDYVALDFYYALTPDLSVAHAAKGRFWRVNFAPAALLTALRDYHQRAPSLPLYVVENGMSLDDGLPRRDGYTRSQHLRDHIYWLQRARSEGIDVIGFNYWSLTDNYEWGDYRNRFGLFTVDVKTDPTLRRKATDAVESLQTLIRQRGVPPGYVPVK